MSPLLFVYGTLLREIPNSRFDLLPLGTLFIGKGRIRGRLYDIGEYPGAVLEPGEAHLVFGEVYAVPGDVKAWERLDTYEGCGPYDPLPHEFERVIAEAEMEDGALRTVWVYVYKRPVEGLVEIPSGNFPGRTG